MYYIAHGAHQIDKISETAGANVTGTLAGKLPANQEILSSGGLPFVKVLFLLAVRDHGTVTRTSFSVRACLHKVGVDVFRSIPRAKRRVSVFVSAFSASY